MLWVMFAILIIVGGGCVLNFMFYEDDQSSRIYYIKILFSTPSLPIFSLKCLIAIWLNAFIPSGLIRESISPLSVYAHTQAIIT